MSHGSCRTTARSTRGLIGTGRAQNWLGRASCTGRRAFHVMVVVSVLVGVLRALAKFGALIEADVGDRIAGVFCHPVDDATAVFRRLAATDPRVNPDEAEKKSE